jgi:outer membrane protein OmpA-like peptidoglycan-associated protein
VPAAPPASVYTDETLLRELERRLDRIETMQRLTDVETRLARVENLGGARIETLRPAPVAAATAATVPVDTTATAATDSLPAAATPPLGALEVAPAASADDAVQARMDQLLGQFEQALAQLSAAPQPAQAMPDPLPATPIPANPQLGGSTTVVVTDPTPRAAAPAQFQPDVALDPELTQPYTYDVSQDAVPGLDPALLRPYASAPTGTPATDAAPAATAFAPKQDVFPVAVGGRLAVKDVDLGLAEPFADPANRTALDTIAALLVRHPEVGVALLVHGVGSDRTAALSLSETQAAALRDYLVAAGANAAQIVPLGMGLAEAGSGASRLEVERLR